MAILVIGVLASQVPNIVATFSDTELSTDNTMCSGNLTLEFIGEPLAVQCGTPSKWYETEWTLVNLGTRSATAAFTLLDTAEHPLDDIEDAGGLYYDPVTGEVIVGNASSEPEGVSEEGGQVGQQLIPPPDPALSPPENLALGNALGGDTTNLYDHLEIKVWFDLNGNGEFTEDEVRVYGKMSAVANIRYELGELPVAEAPDSKGGGWGQYFTYHIQADGQMVVPLLAGKTNVAGSVIIFNDEDNLYVTYDTTDTGWYLNETHLYVGKEPPARLSPGKFPYGDDPLPDDTTTWTYTMSLDSIAGNDVYIAAHSVVCDRSGCETGWAKPGDERKMKIAVHMQQVEDPTWDGDPQLRWWPTNSYQGDKVIFDILLEMGQDVYCRHWGWERDESWTYEVIKRGVFDKSGFWGW